MTFRLKAASSKTGIASSLEISRIGALTGWEAPDPYSVIDEVFRGRIEAAGISAGRS